MDEAAVTIRQGIRFGNGEARASNRFFDAEAFSEAAGESSFAGADIAEEFNNYGFDGS